MAKSIKIIFYISKGRHLAELSCTDSEIRATFSFIGSFPRFYLLLKKDKKIKYPFPSTYSVLLIESV